MKSLLLILLTLSTSVLFAQQDRTVKLKNGSEIRGRLLDLDSTGVRLQTKDGSIWSFASNEVAGIEKFTPKVSGKGIFLRAEVGVVGGSELSPSILFSNGYSFNEHWDVGLAIGWENYFWDAYVPFLATGRYNILNKHWTPFVEVSTGYLMPMRNWDNNSGGLGSGVKLGYTKYFGNRMGFSTSLGYRYAYLKEVNSWWDDFITIRHANRIELKFALTFK
ncbi:hypothetical protein K6119_09055 [Paracrocinitomix mangrovi]|uniref:hypothetical protein n=1 Tax=Paracrocinitomix mangrovi TaxID=2862509 RepID=UPI001C8E12D1|nr:hypothetical protein [Paracrocinitomix mangrovi]UKN03660.1 hypothetical protein K6119_09055 [Paracrocinitomix mangrovi]